MSTIPYLLNGELIDLVPKSELDKALADNAELLERLEERTQSHIHASARDVQTIQRQAVELAKWQALAEGLATVLDDADGSSYHLEGDACLTPQAYDARKAALAAYEACKKGEQP
jgi:hypothetical protein